ncbi:2TM domain-containing protein [Kribbella sp. HUAS MG21]|uniref:2TM domain-containing protein n=1 Tax=Kribbella sp. HUAS MG21 TaxID=3160966 RepID=A0AAU7T7X3_9ACTN
MDDKKLVDRTAPPRTDDELREQAVTELQKRRELAGHLMAFVLVNTFLVVIWYVTGAGFFWPVFPIFGWGIGVVFHTWDVLWPQPTETSIRTTMDRIARRR